MPDIDALREEYQKNCRPHLRDDNGCFYKPMPDGNFNECTILTDGQCPRPTAPREIDVRILAAARKCQDEMMQTAMATDETVSEYVAVMREDAAARQQAALTAENDEEARAARERGNPALRGKP
jgi:hypothetical protein